MKKNIIQIFSGNFLSKVLGLARELLLSRFFGTGEINAAYRIAQSGTLIPINFLTSDSLNAAFIPLYKKFLLEDYNKAHTFKWIMYLLFIFVSFFVFFGIYYFKGFWVSILAPGINDQTRLLTENLLGIMAICTPFYLCSALVNYVSMAHDDFIPMSMRATIQNIGMLIGVICAFYLKDYTFLAWGFTGSYIVFCIWVFSRKNRKVLYCLPDAIKIENMSIVFSQFFHIMKPLVFLPIILQGNIALERALSSLISVDAISALDYARFITDTLNFFIAIPIAFAGLSNWSSSDISKTRDNLKKINVILIFFGISTSYFIYQNATAIITLLFKRGAFDQDSVITTASYLKGICVGLWAQIIGYIFVKALSAHFLNKKVLLIVSVSVVMNMLVNVLLYKSAGAYGIGIGSSVNGFVLFFFGAYYLGILKDLVVEVMKISAGVSIFFVISFLLEREGIMSYDASLVSLTINALLFCLFIFSWGMLFNQTRGVCKIIVNSVAKKIL